MSDPTIRAALEKAERAPTKAAAVAAFLRAMERHYVKPREPEVRWAVCGTLAAAVEEAAKDG